MKTEDEICCFMVVLPAFTHRRPEPPRTPPRMPIQVHQIGYNGR